MTEPTEARTTWCSRNVLALGLVSFLTDIHSEMILALLPQFMANVLGLSMGAIGAIEGIAETTASLLKVASGWYSDRIGKRKPVVLAGYAVSTATKPLLCLATMGWHVLGVRIADRIGKGVRTSARDALLADSVAPEHRGRAYGFHRGMDTAGAVVGTTLAIVLLGLLGGDYRRVFLIATAAGVLAVVTILAGVRECTPGAARKTGGAKVPVQGSLTGFLVAHTVFSAGNFTYAFFLLRAQDAGVDPAFVPSLYLLHNVVYAGAAYPAGALLDRVGPRRAQVLAYLSHVLPCLGLAAFASPALMPLWFALYGVQLGATGACTRATAAGLIASSGRGLGMGIFHACEGGGLLIAGLVSGQVWQATGSGAFAFYYGAGLAVIAATLAARALAPRRAQDEEPL